MDNKKLVLPGEYLSSGEEAEPGGNTYVERDEMYSSTFGEAQRSAGSAAVRLKGRTLELPHVGMDVYCLITKTSPNKAVAGCIPVGEVEGAGRGMEIEAVLPVTAIRRGYVNDLRDEVKIGDIIRAKIKSVEKTGVEISILGPDSGVVVAFCPRCRSKMGLSDNIFICGSCGWKERKKLPGSGEEGGGEERRGPFRREGFRPRREGFRPREGFRGARGGPRPAGGRPQPRKRYEYGR